MRLVRIITALKIKRCRPKKMTLSFLDLVLNKKFRLSFKTNTRLRLIVIRTIEAAHIQVNSYHILLVVIERSITMLLDQLVALGALEVFTHHLGN